MIDQKQIFVFHQLGLDFCIVTVTFIMALIVRAVLTKPRPQYGGPPPGNSDRFEEIPN